MCHIHSCIENKSTTVPSFTLFIYPPPPSCTFPFTSPVSLSYPTLFKCLFIVQWGFALVICLQIYCTLTSLKHSNILPYTVPPSLNCSTVFCALCCVLFLHSVMHFNIIHILSFFSSFTPPLVSSNNSTIGNMLCTYICIYKNVCNCIWIYRSTYERKHVTFVFPNLTYFT
jgi:hypothetical protein